MTEATDENPEKPKKKGVLVPLALAALLGCAGFATTYIGLWSPSEALTTSRAQDSKAVEDQPVFVAVPALELPLPGSSHRNVILATMIETDSAHQDSVEHLLPRISDLFNGFISDIDPAAFDKRGVLEIIRAELLVRTRQILGDTPVKDLLITEFRLK